MSTHRVVPAEIPLGKCVLLVVGEAPGPKEAEQGRPFVGPSGRLLRRLIQDSGLIDGVAYTNVVKHHPVDKYGRTRSPEGYEVAWWMPVLLNELNTLSPQAILCVGAVAAKALGRKGSIGQQQGRWGEWNGIPTMAVYHPAHLLRQRGNPTAYKRIEQAIRSALERLRVRLSMTAQWPLSIAPVLEAPATLAGHACDTETTGIDPDARIVLISAVPANGRPEPIRVWPPTNGLPPLGEGMIFHNALFDLPLLRSHGLALPREVDDTKVLAWLLQERTTHLKELSELILRVPTVSYQEAVKSKNLESIVRYSGQDALLTRMIFERLRPRLKTEEWYYTTIAKPLLPILSEASARGFVVDHKRLSDVKSKLESTQRTLMELIRQAAPRDFNPASPRQLASVLYDDPPKGLGLPVYEYTTSSEPSTSKTALTALLAYSPLPRYVLSWRAVTKLLSTYIYNLEGRDTVKTLYGFTDTGRLTSSSVNLQNLPKPIKGLLRARPGNVLVVADYDQIELKVAACLSGDKRMLDYLISGVDLHAELAKAVYGVVTAELRRKAKVANFEWLYGGGLDTRAKVLGVTKSVASRQVDMFPGWAAYSQRIAEEALRDGYVATVTGRRRRLWDLSSTDAALRRKAAREAINTPVQGSVADMVNYAVVILNPWIRQLGGLVLHQEHDSIICEVPETNAAEAVEAVRRAMFESAPWFHRQLPITASVSVSTHWI